MSTAEFWTTVIIPVCVSMSITITFELLSARRKRRNTSSDET